MRTTSPIRTRLDQSIWKRSLLNSLRDKRYSSYHLSRKCSNLSLICFNDFNRLSLEEISWFHIGSFSSSYLSKYDEWECSFRNALGVRGTISLAEKIYVKGREFMAVSISDNNVKNSKYSNLDLPIVLFKQSFTTLIMRSQAAPIYGEYNGIRMCFMPLSRKKLHPSSDAIAFSNTSPSWTKLLALSL